MTHVKKLNKDPLDKAIKDYLALKDAKEKIGGIDLKGYIDDEKRKRLNSIIQDVLLEIDKKVRERFIDYNALCMLNTTIDIMKKQVEMKKEIKTKPATTGLTDLFNMHSEINKKLDNMIKVFKKEDICDFVKLGEIKAKGELYLEKRWIINPNNMSKVKYDKNIKVGNLKRILSNLEECKKNIYKSTLSEKKEKLVTELQEASISSFKNIVGRQNRVVESDKETEYSPSNGEKHMLAFNSQILQDCDVFLLDEPEAGLGNEYVSEIIVPQIKERIKLGKTFVIVTHNSNIGVRLLPYQTIYMSYDNEEKKYNVYKGNPFTNKLVDIEKDTEELVWTNVSQKTLEGGKEAFMERRNIYERR